MTNYKGEIRETRELTRSRRKKNDAGGGGRGWGAWIQARKTKMKDDIYEFGCRR
jgi:hypothetical protein